MAEGTANADGGVTLLAIGIDNVSILEELFGPDLGADIEAAVQDRLRRRIPHIAEIRSSGHRKTLVAIPGCGENDLSTLVAALQADMASDTIPTSQGPVAVTVSVGAVETAAVPEGLIEAAALHALHTAMSTGPGSFHKARDDSALLEYRAELMSAARASVSAIESDRLAIAYQPVVRAAGSDVIAFHECLARIRSSGGEILKAASFLPAIERLGLAPLIDRHVLKMALATLRSHPRVRLSLNIFPHTMQDRSWLEVFDAGCDRDPGLAERLIIEVTETAAMLDANRTCTFMDGLRASGVSFAMDDFGAGHTSIGSLRDFRFDILKIDGGLTRAVDSDPDKAFLVHMVVQLAERFEMATVAEAVQSMAEARALRDLGVEYFQGFQFGSPSLILNPTDNPMPMIAAQV